MKLVLYEGENFKCECVYVFVHVLGKAGLARQTEESFVFSASSDTAQPVPYLPVSLLNVQEHAVAPFPHHLHHPLYATGKFITKKKKISPFLTLSRFEVFICLMAKEISEKQIPLKE